jgi:hypothetical protein
MILASLLDLSSQAQIRSLPKFQEFKTLAERLFDHKIITMQTDCGGEYEKFNSFFTKVGISHHVSCSHTHQQNRAAEHKH